MSINLRPYQSNAIDKIKSKILSGKKKLIVMSATGSGKTAVMATIVNMALKKNSTVLTVMYGSDLVLQTSKVFKKYYAFDSQIIMGNIKQKYQDSIIGSISTLNRRNLPDVDFVLIDEAHNKYDKIIEHYKDKIIIGFSATPFANCYHFEDSVIVTSIKDLIKDGHLVRPIHYAPKASINTENVAIKNGDYVSDQLGFEALKVTGDIVSEWIKMARHRPTVAFCVNIEHSQTLAKAFVEQGIRAQHLDASNSNEERDEALKKLTTGELEIITNVMIFTTGIDCPDISCIINARPTKSEILYIQTNGRGLRPSANKTDCIILDHANNVSRFGLLTDDRQPILEKRIGNKKASPLLVSIWGCLHCYCTNANTDTHCIGCGNPKPVKKKSLKSDSGELQEITNIEVRKKQTKIYYFDTMPFGKHKGKKFSEIPLNYLLWLSKENLKTKQLKNIIDLEIKRRDQLNENFFGLV